MSLDVYLELPGGEIPEREAIFIRENRANREVTRAEWDALYPGREPVVVRIGADFASTDVYWANITHNLNTMADAAGIYKHLWRPEEVGATKAADLIGPLSSGLEALKADPEKYKALNPANGWGNYEGLVSFVGEYLAACKRFPEARIRISR